MARLFTDGAESGDTLFFEVPQTGTGGTSSSTTQARIGGRSYAIGNDQAQKNITASSEFYARFAIFWTTNVVIQFQWRSSGTILGSIRKNTGNNCLDIYTGTSTLQVAGTKVLNQNTWYVIEVHVKIADAGGVIEFKVDGTLQTGFSGDTKPGAETTVNQIIYNGGTGGNNYFDDLALNDTTGGADNSWCGDAHIYALTPNGNGTYSQFTNSAGNSTNNYTYVDEVPSNSDTDYVQSATSTNKDLYAFSNLPSLPTGSSINRVIVETRARELTADGQAIKLGVKSSSTESYSSAITVGLSYARQVYELTTDPATSAAWTESAVNALEAGVQIP